MPLTLLQRFRALQGVASEPGPDSALRRIWPKLRLALMVSFVAEAVCARLALSARLVDQGLVWRVFLPLAAVTLLFGVAEEILERLRWIDKQKPAKPALDVAEIPVRPVPPPVADTAPRAQNPLARRLPERLGGVTWELEGGYDWRRRPDA